MEKTKKISIGIIILLALGMIAVIYQASGYSRNSSEKWVEYSLPNGKKAIDIGVGHNSGVYCIDDDSNSIGVWQWNEANKKWDWVSSPQKLVRISVGPEGNPWAISENNEILKRENSGWTTIPKTELPDRDILDIAAGYVSSLFVIVAEQGKSEGIAYRYNKKLSLWNVTDEETLITRISVGASGLDIHAINGYTHKTYKADGTVFKEWYKVEKGYAWYDVGGASSYPYILGYYRHWRYGASVVKYIDGIGWEYVCHGKNDFPYYLATSIDVGYKSSVLINIWTVNDQGRVFSLEENTSPSEPWQVGATYKIGDIVSYNNVLYECIQGHTVYAPNWTPPNTPALWKPL